MSKKDKKKTAEQKKIEAENVAREKSFQDRLPIEKITKGLFLTKKGEYYPVFALGQKAVDLMSEDEVYSFARNLETTFEMLGLVSVQFLLLPVPFDLQPYQAHQQRRIKELKLEEEQLKQELNRCDDLVKITSLEQTLSQNQLCQKYISEQNFFVVNRLQSGRIANKHSYAICKIKDCYNETAVLEASRQIDTALRSVIPDSHRCTENELEKILIELFNPLRAEIYINAN